MFRVRVPFFWFSVPENLRVEARPNYIEFYEELGEELIENKFARIVPTIFLSVLIVIYSSDAISPVGLSFVPVLTFLAIVILLNLPRRIKLIVFDFSENKVKLKPVTFSFIGSKSAKMSSPFKCMIKKKTIERKHNGEHSSWTTYHEGYEILVRLEKRGYDSIMFLETDDIRRDYGELIGKLAAVAGIDDPLLEIAEN